MELSVHINHYVPVYSV